MVDSAPQSIAVLLMGSLGDVVRGMSLVAPLKERFPQAELTWIVEPSWAPVVRLHPLVDRVLIFDRPRGIRAALELIKEMRRSQFDLLLDLQRHLKSGLFSLFSGAQRTLGVHRQNAKEGNWLFHSNRVAAVDRSRPKQEIYLRFLAALSARIPDTPQLQLSLPELPERIAGPIGRAPILAVLGSSWTSKDWVAEGYIRTIKRLLAAQEVPIVLVGAAAQRPVGAEIIAAVNDPRLISIVGETSLTELVAVIARSCLAFGPDSGPGHLAAALGKPYVGLFGPTDPAITAPWGNLELAVSSRVGCAPCYRRRCPGLGQICMRGLAPSVVSDRVIGALGSK